MVSPVGGGSPSPVEPPTHPGRGLLFEIGDRAYLYAETTQRDERWWLNEWGRVENRKRAYKALEGETSVAARRDNRNG